MAKTSTERTQRTRERYRQSGMRLLQIWVPDTRSPAFAAEAQRQSRLLSARRDLEVDAWLDENNRALFAELDEAERIAR